MQRRTWKRKSFVTASKTWQVINGLLMMSMNYERQILLIDFEISNQHEAGCKRTIQQRPGPLIIVTGRDQRMK